MNTHRMWATPAPDGEPDYVWLEVDKDTWMEVSPDCQPDDSWHDQIHAILSKEENRGTIKYATRAFRIGIIDGPVKELKPIVE